MSFMIWLHGGLQHKYFFWVPHNLVVAAAKVVWRVGSGGASSLSYRSMVYSWSPLLSWRVVTSDDRTKTDLTPLLLSQGCWTARG